ncbi:MAG: hypothetical protein ACLURG_14455 [Gemmiger sp.]
MQTKPRRTVLGFRLLTVVIGLLLLLIIGLYSIRTDNFEGEQNFASRVDYIKDQCDDYTSLSLATESKSMLRIAEACEQCARDIQTGTDAVEAEVLSRCAENHYLTGIAVLEGTACGAFQQEGAAAVCRSWPPRRCWMWPPTRKRPTPSGWSVTMTPTLTLPHRPEPMRTAS